MKALVKANRAPKRDLFAELSEGMEARDGKRPTTKEGRELRRVK